MGSDGIDDSFKNEEDMYDFYKTILYAFSISDYNKKAGINDHELLCQR